MNKSRGVQCGKWFQGKWMTGDETLDSITESMDMSLSKLWEVVEGRETWHAEFMWSQRVGHNNSKWFGRHGD